MALLLLIHFLYGILPWRGRSHTEWIDQLHRLGKSHKISVTVERNVPWFSEKVAWICRYSSEHVVGFLGINSWRRHRYPFWCTQTRTQCMWGEMQNASSWVLWIGSEQPKWGRWEGGGQCFGVVERTKSLDTPWSKRTRELTCTVLERYQCRVKDGTPRYGT